MFPQNKSVVLPSQGRGAFAFEMCSLVQDGIQTSDGRLTDKTDSYCAARYLASISATDVSACSLASRSAVLISFPFKYSLTALFIAFTPRP